MQAGAELGESAIPATASAARVMAAPVASRGSAPRRICSASTATPVSEVTREASSERGELDTPSQTTAQTVPGAWGASASRTRIAMASSLRLCRRPRSLTPAAACVRTSTWSRPVGWRRPHLSQ